MKTWHRVGLSLIGLAFSMEMGCGHKWQYDGEFGIGSISPLPDQSAIVYSAAGTGPSHIYSVSWNGQKTRQLTSDARADSDVCVAPSEKFLVFVRQQGNNVHLWRANVDGTSQRQLTFGPGCETQPTVSPHGDRIAYVVSDPVPGSTYALSMMWTNGTHRQILTPRSTSKQDTTPTFDPTGTKVYFSRFPTADTVSLRGEVWAVNLSGNGGQCIGFGDDPAASPDGKHVAYFDQPQNQTLGLMNANGSGREIIHQNVDYGTCIRYSPDGHQLLVNGGDSNKSTIWAIPEDGTGTRAITSISLK